MQNSNKLSLANKQSTLPTKLILYSISLLISILGELIDKLQLLRTRMYKFI